jgi:hypothetical protein
MIAGRRKAWINIGLGLACASLWAAPPAGLAAASSSRDAQALKKACATGALTPYACALRGIKVPGSNVVVDLGPPPPPAAPPAPPAGAPSHVAAKGQGSRAAKTSGGSQEGAAPKATGAGTAQGPGGAAPAGGQKQADAQPPSAATAAKSPAAKAVKATKAAASAKDGRPVLDGAKAASARTPLAVGSGPVYEDAKGRFLVNIPDGWSLRMQGSEPGFAHGADWIVVRGMTSLPPTLAAKAALNLLNAQYASYHITDQAPTEVGGRKGFETQSDAVTVGGRPASILVVTAPISRGDNLVILAGGAPEDAPLLKQSLAAFIASLKFR